MLRSLLWAHRLRLHVHVVARLRIDGALASQQVDPAVVGLLQIVTVLRVQVSVLVAEMLRRKDLD